VFPRRTSHTPTDELAFVGPPPLWRPDRHESDEVHVCCVFTWDREKAHRLAEVWGGLYDTVLLGGPAIEAGRDGDDRPFVPGRYLELGATITSRGCPNRCAHCLVPNREGKLVELDVEPGHIIQDNNILATSRTHFRRVCEMLRTQRLPEFRGGLEAARLSDWHVDKLRSLRLPQQDALWFACDTESALGPLRKAVAKLHDLDRRQLRCYVLCATPGDSIAKATARLELVWQAGCLPFAQLYQPADRIVEYSSHWKGLARDWSRPALTYKRHETV